MVEEKANNDIITSAKAIIKAKINVKAGDLTFGQRIELGKLITKKSDQTKLFEDVFFALHSYKPKAAEYSILVEYFNEIIEGIAFWNKQESELLKYEPTAKQKRAGIKDLSKKIGELGTIKALAKAYSTDPDIILKWKYGKVFGILYTDLEEHKYNLKYSELK